MNRSACVRHLWVPVVLCSSILAPIAVCVGSEGKLLDEVLVSVEGEPITRRDVERALEGSEVGEEVPERFELALQTATLQEVLAKESKRLGIRVNQGDIDRYIDQIASQNQLSRPQFEKALTQRGISLKEYSEQVAFEIRRIKLASQVMREPIAISDNEVDQYLEENPSLEEGKKRGLLRRIVLNGRLADSPSLQEKVSRVQTLLSADDAEFGEVARSISDGPESASGGLIGLIAVTDLNERTRDMLLSLPEQTASKPLVMDSSVQFFFFDQVFDEEVSASATELREAVRLTLSERNKSSKVDKFFGEELLSRYSVERL